MSFNRELIGVYLSTDQVFGSSDAPDRRCVIGTVRLLDGKRATVKGYASEERIECGITYRFFGQPRTHPKYGEQFNFQSLCEEQPCDEDSILAYLETCRKPERGSITKRVALLLYERFGPSVIDQLIGDPIAAALDIRQWDAAKAARASEYLRGRERTRGCTLDLITILNGRGFPKKTVDRAINEWGAAAAVTIRTDPYALLQLKGIGFKGADKLYCDLAKEQVTSPESYQARLAAIQRQGLCAAYAATSDNSGSTWLAYGPMIAAVKTAIGNTQAKPDEALDWAVMDGRLAKHTDHQGQDWYAVARRALNEADVAAFVADPSEKHEWPITEQIMRFAPADKPLSEHQLYALDVSLLSRVCCLQGSPGVGKTFVVACVVKALIKQFGRDAIAVAAPTGKAGVRVTQSMAANGVDLPASTIHRLLGVVSEGKGGTWGFFHTDQNPLPQKFIVLDESSMMDCSLLASLVAACTPTSHLLMVGDSNQLAPVGAGRPFLDLQTVVPTGHLTEIHRNSGRIVRACAEIRDSRKISFSPTLDLAGGENMPLIQVGPDDQVAALEALMGHITNRVDDPIDDIQIVTAKNDGSPVSRKPLNKLLQGRLNPDGEQIAGNPFRVGDKVVCVRNGKYQDAEEPSEEHFTANGELGRVVSLKPGRMIVRLSDPVRQIAVIHGPIQEHESGIADSEDAAQRGAVGDWDLGYCISVHRSQGSQWPYVIVMADNAGQMVQSRQWIYTAISRAEKVTYVIGERAVVNAMMRRDGISGRKTFLVEEIKRLRLSRTVDWKTIWAEV